MESLNLLSAKTSIQIKNSQTCKEMENCDPYSRKEIIQQKHSQGTHILELAEKNFIVAIINTFENLKENIAKMSEQVNQVGVLEPTRLRNEKLTDWPNIKLEATEERVSELEDRPM